MKLIFFVLSILILDSAFAAKKSRKKRRVKISQLLESKHPRKYEKLTVFLVHKKYYFSAVSFAKEHLVTWKKDSSDQFKNALERIIIETGGDQFTLLDDKYLINLEIPALNFVLGKKYFHDRKWDKAIEYLNLLPRKHKFQTEAHLILGGIFLKRKKYAASEIEYDKCLQSAKFEKSMTSREKAIRFYDVLKESCLINKARMNYERGKYKEALKLYGEIPKRSFLWPYTLLEKGWAHYKVGDYNRSLGAIVTYKSPLMESYFMPEAEVLMGLNYYRLCLWKDSMRVIDHFHSYYAPKAQALKDIIYGGQEYRYFYDLMTKTKGLNNKLLKGLKTQISKEIYFNINLQLLKEVRSEIKNLKKQKPSKLKDILLQNNLDFEQRQIFLLSKFIRNKLVDFVNSMNFYSKELYKIYLESITDMKTVLYKDKEVPNTRARGSLKNIERERTQYFWSFAGEFWADELGEYVFGLKSNCKEKSNE